MTLSWSLVTQEAGIGVRLGELAGLIQETMESYEVEVDGKVISGTIPETGGCHLLIID